MILTFALFVAQTHIRIEQVQLSLARVVLITVYQTEEVGM